LREADVPTLPIVAQKLIELCKDDNADFGEFAQVIESDPGLASRILFVANSAYYGLRNKVTNLERAISTLGIGYIKSISLGFHLATTLNQFETIGFDLDDFWRQSVLRGSMARQLAARCCSEYREEAFLIGLLQDCGIPILTQVLKEKYARMWSECNSSPAAMYKLERKLFKFNHVHAAAAIAKQWSLPELLAEPIRSHHLRSMSQPSLDKQVQLCQISYFTGNFSLNNPDSICDEDICFLDYCRSAFGVDENDIHEILERSKQEFMSVSKLFSGILHDQVDVSTILSNAKNILSELNNDTHQKVFDCQTEIDRLEELNRKYSESVEHYRQKSQKDDLTGLVTRNQLNAYLNRAGKNVKEKKTTLMVLFIDIDDFSIVNNKHGHVAGDCVLKELGKLLNNLFHNNGCVARYGGDEFVVALMGLKIKQAIKITKSLLENIRKLHPAEISKGNSDDILFTCSIGMLFCDVGANPGHSNRIIELADNQMYEAKNKGKNSMSYQIMAPSIEIVET